MNAEQPLNPDFLPGATIVIDVFKSPWTHYTSWNWNAYNATSGRRLFDHSRDPFTMWSLPWINGRDLMRSCVVKQVDTTCRMCAVIIAAITGSYGFRWWLQLLLSEPSGPRLGWVNDEFIIASSRDAHDIDRHP